MTKKLLTRYHITTPTISYHQHTKSAKTEKIIDALRAGENVALVTDAGTPGISDPGNKFVATALEKGIIVIPIPGSSALAAIVSVAGIDMQKFVFLGFPPHKKGRQTFFQEVATLAYPVVYFESPHRVVKNLVMLNEFAPQKRIVIGRELTKMFEETVRGSVHDAIEYFTRNPKKVKGEFVVIVSE